MTPPDGDTSASRASASRAWAPVAYLPGVQPAASPSGPASSLETRSPGIRPPELAGQPILAHNVAVSALARRALSRREIERLLDSREFEDDVVAEEIERLDRDGLIDDLALSQTLVGSLQERKGLGRSGIAAELTRRLLSPAAIEYGLELVDSGDELARARELAVKRARQLSSYDHETAVRRLSAYLSRRGYSGSTVRAAVEQALPRSNRSVRFS